MSSRQGRSIELWKRLPPRGPSPGDENRFRSHDAQNIRPVIRMEKNDTDPVDVHHVFVVGCHRSESFHLGIVRMNFVQEVGKRHRYSGSFLADPNRGRTCQKLRDTYAAGEHGRISFDSKIRRIYRGVTSGDYGTETHLTSAPHSCQSSRPYLDRCGD